MLRYQCTVSTTRPLKKGLTACVACFERTPAEEWNVSLNKGRIIQKRVLLGHAYATYTHCISAQ